MMLNPAQSASFCPMCTLLSFIFKHTYAHIAKMEIKSILSRFKIQRSLSVLSYIGLQLKTTTTLPLKTLQFPPPPFHCESTDNSRDEAVLQGVTNMM